MTSHIRHRRGTPVPATIEAGEVVVDPANRQLTAGDIAPAAGVPLPMIAIRYFDTRTSYLIHEYAVQAGQLYRSIVAVAPGPFNPAQWEVVGAAGPAGPPGPPGPTGPQGPPG